MLNLKLSSPEPRRSKEWGEAFPVNLLPKSKLRVFCLICPFPCVYSLRIGPLLFHFIFTYFNPVVRFLNSSYQSCRSAFGFKPMKEMQLQLLVISPETPEFLGWVLRLKSTVFCCVLFCLETISLLSLLCLILYQYFKS